MPRSLRIHSTAKPKSNSPRAIVAARFSICQLCAAPWRMTSTTASGSSPARAAKLMPSARPWTMPAMQIWLTILVSCPAPARPISDVALAYDCHHRLDELVERLVVGAAHHRELPGLGAGLAARHRGVDEADAELGRSLGQLAGQPGRRGGVVDEHRTRPRRRRARRRIRRRRRARRRRCRRT